MQWCLMTTQAQCLRMSAWFSNRKIFQRKDIKDTTIQFRFHKCKKLLDHVSKCLLVTKTLLIDAPQLKLRYIKWWIVPPVYIIRELKAE